MTLETIEQKIAAIQSELKSVCDEITATQFKCIDLTEKRNNLRDELKELEAQADRILAAMKN